MARDPFPQGFGNSPIVRHRPFGRRDDSHVREFLNIDPQKLGEAWPKAGLSSERGAVTRRVIAMANYIHLGIVDPWADVGLLMADSAGEDRKARAEAERVATGGNMAGFPPIMPMPIGLGAAESNGKGRESKYPTSRNMKE